MVGRGLVNWILVDVHYFPKASPMQSFLGWRRKALGGTLGSIRC